MRPRPRPQAPPGSRVTLRPEERLALSSLEDRAGAGRLRIILALGSVLAHLRTARLATLIGCALLGLGMALTLATFAQSLVLGAVGAALQGGALWIIVSNDAGRSAAMVRRLSARLLG